MADEEAAYDGLPGYETSYVTGRIVADDPASFRATVRTVCFDHVRVEIGRSGPSRYVRTAEDVAATTEPIITVLVVGEGGAVGTVDAAPLVLSAGDVFLFDTTAEVDVHWTVQYRYLRCMIATRHLPDFVLAGPPLPAGSVTRTALVNSSIAFLSALMADGNQGARTPQLVQAVSDLVSGMLGEVRGVMAHEPGVSGLRFRIESHVMDHLGDAKLSPGTIGTALGISLRSVHHAFEGEDMTVARLIRDRRLDAVALELRERRDPVPMSDLAERHGFASRDQLARSFRQRYGSTMKEYRAVAQVAP